MERAVQQATAVLEFTLPLGDAPRLDALAIAEAYGVTDTSL